MKRILCLGAVALLCVSAAFAGTQVLTFEGLQDGERVHNYYNGGSGGSGSGPGPNFGVAFSNNSRALISIAGGGTGHFSNNPSGDTILYFTSGSGDVMNVAAGFTTGFSFYYSAAETGVVKVYSGTNGTGTLLASLNLSTTPNPYTVWDTIGVTFAGTAKSVKFGGNAGFIGFDDITLGSSSPAPAPEPGSLVLLGTGLLGAAGAIRRKLKA